MKLSVIARVTALSILAVSSLAGCDGTAVTSQVGEEQSAQQIAVAVDPQTAQLAPTGTVQFAATVTGTVNTGVEFLVAEASGGTVDPTSGQYVAPSVAGVYHVVARSLADPAVQASATVTVTTPPPAAVAVEVAPSYVSLSPGATQTFTATVTGTSNTGVTWSVQEASGCGSITAAGLYTAGTASSCHVVATSAADGTKSAVAAIAIVAPPIVAPPPTGSASLLGVNLEGVVDWSAPFFADLIKQGRRWNVIGNLSTPVAMDADGWPTGDAQIVVATPPAMVARTEPYKLSFVGNATVSALGGTVSNKLYDAATNTTTADVYITAPDASQPHRNGNVFLSFAGQAGGVKKVRLLRPGHGPSEIFSQDMLARISRFSTLRLIAFLGPANKQVTANTDREWTDRGLPGYALQTQDAPAWEYVALLANSAKKDVWIGIPYNASDAYITKLAQLFKYGSDGVNPYTSPQANPVYPPLAPDRKLYFEYSNELWNSVYPTTAQNENDTAAEVAAGDPHHLAYVTGNNYELSWRRVGWLAVRTSNLFRAVFGDADMMTRVRPVLARQMVRYDTFDQPLKYINAVFGAGNAYGNPGHPVSYYLYAISGAGYVNILSADAGRTDLTVDQVFTSMQSYANTVLYPAFDWIAAKAASYGVVAVAYESGQHLLPQQGSGDAKLAAQMDPRMGTLTLQLLDRWVSAGGQGINYYTLCSDWGAYGYWGLSTDMTNEATPKWDAVKTFVSR